MERLVCTLLVLFGITLFYTASFAQDCSLTVKCVCESKNHIRVVPCPDHFENDAFDCTEQSILEDAINTCKVNCGSEVNAYCDEIPFDCKNNEQKNCLVTLPMTIGVTPSECQVGETDCSGDCIDTDNDAANCGECGMQCAVSETCVSGICVPASCEVGETDCSGDCIDTDNDAANCGECGNQCAELETCVLGNCQGTICTIGLPCDGPDLDFCEEGTVISCDIGTGDPVCSDTTGDNLEICNGQDDDCDGLVDEDTDLGSDEAHCGSCNNPCVDGETCTAGVCGL